MIDKSSSSADSPLRIGYIPSPSSFSVAFVVYLSISHIAGDCRTEVVLCLGIVFGKVPHYLLVLGYPILHGSQHPNFGLVHQFMSPHLLTQIETKDIFEIPLALPMNIPHFPYHQPTDRTLFSRRKGVTILTQNTEAVC